MRLLHSLAKTRASFDDRNLVSHAGLVPVMALAGRAGLGDLAAEHVRPAGECGVNSHLKVPCRAGMAAGSTMTWTCCGSGAMSTRSAEGASTLGSHLRYLGQREPAGEGWRRSGSHGMLPGAGSSLDSRSHASTEAGRAVGDQGKSLLGAGRDGQHALSARCAVINADPLAGRPVLRHAVPMRRQSARDRSNELREVAAGRPAGCLGLRRRGRETGYTGKEGRRRAG